MKIDPHALTDGQVIAIAKMLEAVGREIAPPEKLIVSVFTEERDRLVAVAVKRAKVTQLVRVK